MTEAPDEVQGLLCLAYGDDFGKTGHDLAGHVSVSEADVASAQSSSSSLLYGELLPSGVALLERALLPEDVGKRRILELGMGTGKVALQLFLSQRRDVYGVELAPSRWELARLALRRLAEARPARFSLAEKEGSVCLVDREHGTECELAVGSLLDTPAEMLASAAGIVMEVCLPRDLQRQACLLLQGCRAGCRVVCYAPLHGLAEGCRLVPVAPAGADESLGDGRGGLSLPASWKPHGHGFAFYEVAASLDSVGEAWAVAADKLDPKVELDSTGNPSRARRMKYTDDVLGAPRESYAWQKGDKVLVGFSWLPFLDLGNPGDDLNGGIDGVTWLYAVVLSIDEEGFVDICYTDDGTVEEKVHPERIRKEGCLEPRPPPSIDWGDDES